VAYWLFLGCEVVLCRWFFMAAVPCFVYMWIGWDDHWRQRDLEYLEALEALERRGLA